MTHCASDVVHALRNLVDINWFRDGCLLAREGKQAVGQGAGPRGRLNRRLDLGDGIRDPALRQTRAHKRRSLRSLVACC